MQGGLYVSGNYLTLDAEMWIAMMSVAEDCSEVYLVGHVGRFAALVLQLIVSCSSNVNGL